MKVKDNTIRKTAKYVVFLWMIVQIVLMVYFWGIRQMSDQGQYIDMALNHFKNEEWYPSKTDLYSMYIWAPGLINYLILQLKLFGTINVNYISNFLLNIGILYNLFFLAKRFFSERTAYLSVFLFCLTYSNIFVVLPAGTEIPFLFLALMALNISLTPKTLNLIIAGVLFALANWIRPLSMIFIVAVLVYMFYKKVYWTKYISFMGAMMILTLLFGYIAKKQMGYFVFQSTTSGINLIMTANDRAYGGVASSLSRDSTSTVYLANAEKYTIFEKDSIYKARSVEWIKEHPFRYAGLYLLKIPGLYIEDSWVDRPIMGGAGFVDKAAHGMVNKMAVFKRGLSMFAKSVVYYFVMLVFLITLFMFRKDIFTEKGLILIVFVAGTLITNVFSVSPRYHYPFIFVAYIWAAYGIDKYLEKKK